MSDSYYLSLGDNIDVILNSPSETLISSVEHRNDVKLRENLQQKRLKLVSLSLSISLSLQFYISLSLYVAVYFECMINYVTNASNHYNALKRSLQNCFQKWNIHCICCVQSVFRTMFQVRSAGMTPSCTSSRQSWNIHRLTRLEYASANTSGIQVPTIIRLELRFLLSSIVYIVFNSYEYIEGWKLSQIILPYTRVYFNCL